MRSTVLLGLMVLIFQLEHQFGLHAPDVGVFSFNLVPVVMGIAWLTPRQAMALGSVNLGLLVFEVIRDADAISSAAPLLLGRILIVGLCIWITHLRAAIDRQRLELGARAANLSEIMDSCLRASALAHEIRQPLSVILLSCQLLQRKLEQMDAPDPDCVNHLQEMVASANQLNLTISAMGALIGSVKTVHARVDLAVVVQSALLSLRPTLQDGGVELISSGLEHPFPVMGDAEQLRIACGNLLSNGCEALQMVPLSQRRMLVRLERSSGQAWLTVADSGVGLPQELLASLPLCSTKTGGMGLGLFIIQAIARHHGGELRAGRSSELGGAELRLILSGCC